MAGIYIPDMEMPETCFKCKFSRITPSRHAWCILTEKCELADDPPPKGCPLIPVPPHGRLGDLDFLNELINAEIEAYMHGYKRSTWDFICELRDVVEKAATIIPAEEGEDG